MSRLPFALAVLFAVASLTSADDKKKPITEVPTVKADKFGPGGTVPEPVSVTSVKELEKAIPDDETRKRIAKLVDFGEQTLLVVAWESSGGDKLTYTVAESFPEQVTFHHKKGLTFDLKSHVKLFVLRNGVKWAVK